MHCSLRKAAWRPEESPFSGSPLLRIEGLSKSFQGIKALEGVSFELYQGELLGLIGPNGAGKTTLINLISGFLKPENGKIYFGDQAIHGKSPEEIARLGIARTFQHLQIFAGLTVFENVLLGFTRRIKRRFWHDLLGLGRAKKEEALFQEEVQELLAQFGLLHLAQRPVQTLPYGDQRRVVLARALASRPQLLLLDEPAAGLSPAEGQELLKTLKEIKRNGLSIILVDHDVDLVLEVCDRVIVLASGEIIAQGSPQEVREHPRVIEAYLGEPHA